jgi:methylthioribose-1-phosphate isomerase
VTVTPLRWENDALHILDQRALPQHEVWLDCATVEQVAEAIETLAVRGAPAIGVAAAYGSLLGSDDFEAALERLARTRPTAINLQWALDRMREAGPDVAAAHAIAAREEESTRLIAEHGRELLEGNVITHCNTGSLACMGVGTALGVIRAAGVEHVWVCETRPLNQGARLTAYELKRDGIAHHVVTDSTAGMLMATSKADCVIVGADRIAANGDTANKIGTYSLAVLAKHHGIPFYVAAPTSTIDMSAKSGDDIPIEERAPEELGTPDARNWAFDVTPAGLITAIVTERGVFRPPYAFD